MRLARALLLALLGSALGACAVGPNFDRPAPPTGAGYGPLSEPVGGPRLQTGGNVPADWWRAFGSPGLDALVDEALSNNPSIAAARASLKAAHEYVLAQRGFFWPSLSASIEPSRQKIPGNLAPVTASGENPYTLTTSQLTVAYSPDIFGANRRSVENLAAQEDEQRFELEAARLTIAANVVAAAVQDASLRAQLAAQNEIVADQRSTLESLRRQLALGQAARADVAAQQALLAQSEAALPPLERAFETNRDVLAALVGRTPAQPASATFDLAALELPAELPVVLPAQLVRQRPDVRMAEAQLHAASAAIGMAVAARYPNLQIAAAAGSAPLALGVSLSNSATFWSVAATLVQPIFDGGTLLHKQRAAEALYAEAKAQYESTVVGAFQNTADALHALATDAAALNAATAAEDASMSSLTIARRQLQLGDVSALSVLAAEEAEAETRQGLVLARANRYADVAALFQALGGGWWSASPAGPPAA